MVAESKGIDTGPAATLNALCRTGADLDLSLVHQALGIVERLEAVIRAETELPGSRDTGDDRGPKLVLDVHRKIALLDGEKYPLTERQTELLPIELKDLQAADYNLDLLGFSADDLAKILDPGGMNDIHGLGTAKTNQIHSQPGSIWPQIGPTKSLIRLN